MDKLRVLFPCTGNDARSLMGEAILRQVAGDRFEVHSAGLNPKDVRTENLIVLEEASYETEALHSKPVGDYLGKMLVHHLIPGCEQAEKNCPRIWPQGGEHLFCPIEDPAIVDGDEAQRLEAFPPARDDLRARILGCRASPAVVGQRRRRFTCGYRQDFGWPELLALLSHRRMDSASR